MTQDTPKGKAQDDPYGLEQPHVIAKREAALARKSFASEAARAAYIEKWNTRFIRKKQKSRALRRAEAEAAREEQAHQELLEAVSKV
ncbi:hypothetical protein, partial [Primorskyibacter sp. S187A]